MRSIGAPLVACAILAAATDNAAAIINGTASWMSGHTVQVVARSGRICTGVVIDSTAVVTAAHCAGYGATILAGGAPAKVTSVTNSIVRADGTRIRVAGDAAILKLAAPIYASPVNVGSGISGTSFTVAGFGTTSEEHPGAVGALHEASLVRAGPNALIDPHRQGQIGASACFGDSGGPVIQGGALVGIITRASHPSPRIACGHLTHFAPVIATVGAPVATSSAPAAASEATNLWVFGSAAQPPVGQRVSSKRKPVGEVAVTSPLNH